MFKKILGRLAEPTPADLLRTRDPDRWEAALLDRVREMSSSDPLIGAKIGGKELSQRLVDTMKNEQGVHAESLMCAAGALAGYACQDAVRSANRAEGRDELSGLSVADTRDGRKYVFGDPLNLPLVEAKMSLWTVAAGGAQACGCTSFPDVGDIFRHVASSVGSDSFGVPRLPTEHPVHEMPIVYLERLWIRHAPMVEKFCPRPEDRVLLYAMCIQDLMAQTKTVLDPCVALKIVMESAIPMSKVILSATNRA